MLILTFFAFIAGIVTILSPCILPILPIVLSGSLTGGHKRPIGIIVGFIGSFTFFTLFLTVIVKLTGLPSDILRNLAVIIIFFFGLSLIIPEIQLMLEGIFKKLTQFTPKTNSNNGFAGGILIGLGLGLVWTPCVGPILASIITLVASSQVTFEAILITFAYSLGTSIPLLAITYGGRNLLNKLPFITQNTVRIQKTFGILMVATAVGIYFNIDRNFQSWILTRFPNYGVGLTKFEDNQQVKTQLEKLKQNKPMLDLFKTDFGNAPEIVSSGQWFNSAPLTIKSLKDKVVLVDFWTYTCINCIRTLPYLKSWHDKYKDKGLIIIGVHTPEFEFEKKAENVEKALKDFGIKYPVVQDNDYATWNAYANHYWPAKYLVDKNGKIRYTHFGEGAYDETETKIQELLSENGVSIVEQINNPSYSIKTKTPELYLGNKRRAFGYLNFSDNWDFDDEFAVPKKNATLILDFEAKEVFLVMRPKEKQAGKLKVYLDNQLVTTNNAGEDIKKSMVEVDTDRLYKLIKLEGPGKHQLKLEFLDNKLELYAFTFG